MQDCQTGQISFSAIVDARLPLPEAHWNMCRTSPRVCRPLALCYRKSCMSASNDGERHKDVAPFKLCSISPTSWQRTHLYRTHETPSLVLLLGLKRTVGVAGPIAWHRGPVASGLVTGLFGHWNVPGRVEKGPRGINRRKKFLRARKSREEHRSTDRRLGRFTCFLPRSFFSSRRFQDPTTREAPVGSTGERDKRTKRRANQTKRVTQDATTQWNRVKLGSIDPLFGAAGGQSGGRGNLHP